MPYTVKKNNGIKTASNGNPFLSLTLDDKTVSFYHPGDRMQNIIEGSIIECKITQNKTFFIGEGIVILSSPVIQIPVSPAITTSPTITMPTQTTNTPMPTVNSSIDGLLSLILIELQKLNQKLERIFK